MRSVGNIPCTVTRKLELNMHWAGTQDLLTAIHRAHAHMTAQRGITRSRPAPGDVIGHIARPRGPKSCIYGSKYARASLQVLYPRALERRALVLSGLQVLPSLTKSAAT